MAGGSASGGGRRRAAGRRRCRSPTRPGSRCSALVIGLHLARAGRGAPSPMMPLHPGRRARRAPAGGRVHARLDAFGREDALGGGLAGDPAGSQIVEARVRAPAPGWSRPPGTEARRWNVVMASETRTADRRVVMRRSGATADWRICIAGKCREMDSVCADGSRPGDHAKSASGCLKRAGRQARPCSEPPDQRPSRRRR